MPDLTADDRESLSFWATCGEESCDSLCEPFHDDIHRTVEQIVARHVTAALSAVAARIEATGESRRGTHDLDGFRYPPGMRRGMSDAARIVREARP